MRLLVNIQKIYERVLKGPRHAYKVGAFAIILDERQRVLLCHRSDIDLWNLPGGGLEKGETPMQAVMREVREETGLKVSVSRLAGIYINPRRNNLAFSFICEIVGGKIKSTRESDAVEYFAVGKIPRYTYPEHVERIKDVIEKPDRLHMKMEYGPSAKKLFKQGKL